MSYAERAEAECTSRGGAEKARAGAPVRVEPRAENFVSPFGVNKIKHWGWLKGLD